MYRGIITTGTKICPIGNTMFKSPFAVPCSDLETDKESIVTFPALAKPIPRPFNIKPRYNPGIEDAWERRKKPKNTINKPHLIKLKALIL